MNDHLFLSMFSFDLWIEKRPLFFILIFLSFMMCYWVSYMVVANSVLYSFVIDIKQRIIPLSKVFGSSATDY